MKNINELLTSIDNKVLMALFPHPDDETMAAGGLLLAVRELGWKTIAVCLTLGEAGRNYLKPDGRPLGEIRRRELTDAAGKLGINTVITGEFTDGKVREETAIWGPWVLKLIKKIKPGLAVTYDHTGFSGHPDHIAVSVFSETLKLPVIWSVPGGPAVNMVNPEVRDYLIRPEYKLNPGGRWIRKWQAARCHKSQKLGNDLPIPLALAFALFGHEYYFPVDRGKKYPYKYVKFKV